MTVDSLFSSLPVEEYKDAYHARRGPWGAAPNCDELWDGDRRVFWERELSSEELREILRFRRLARYATMLQGGVGIFGMRVPMPKIPPVIEELVREARAQQSANSSPRSTSTPSSEAFTYDNIALPHDDYDNSPRIGETSQKGHHSHSDGGKSHHDGGSPRHSSKRASGTLSVTTVDELYSKKASSETFEFTNPNLLPHSTPPVPVEGAAKRLSSSQKAAMQNVGKVLKLDSPRMGHAVHKSRSRKSRARKRIAAHSILQPAYVLLYFLIPLIFMASVYFVPFWRGVYIAWKDQRAIRAAIEVPWLLERLLKVPDIPILQGTIYIGLFAVEVTSIIYLIILAMSQLTMFIVVRPLLLSLAASFSEKGAAGDST